MTVHNGNQHIWRCDLCREISNNSLCLIVRRFHCCVSCWFKLDHSPGLKGKVFSVFKKRKVVRAIPEKVLDEIHYPGFCNHLDGCNHRESFHVGEMPTGGDHVKKSAVYQFISWDGQIQHLRRN